jgi:hypothetical protein
MANPNAEAIAGIEEALELLHSLNRQVAKLTGNYLRVVSYLAFLADGASGSGVVGSEARELIRELGIDNELSGELAGLRATTALCDPDGDDFMSEAELYAWRKEVIPRLLAAAPDTGLRTCPKRRRIVAALRRPARH